MLWYWGAAKGVQHDCPLVRRARDEDIVNGPVILVKAIMSWLPPSEASGNLFSIRREKDIHKSRLAVLVIENLHQQVPGDASIDRVLQQDSLVTVARRNEASIHKVKLDKLSIGEVQIHSD